MIRALTLTAAIVAALPSLATAQSGRGFKDSWFWGIKGGGFALADSGRQYKQAPVAGIDWLITRTHGGLYISGSQVFSTQQTYTLRDPVVGADSGFRVIDVKDVRKLDVALMGFPGEHLRFHPYFGAGFTLSEAATAAGRGPYSSEDQITATDSVIQNGRTSFSPLFMAGAQYRMTRFSVFGQASFTAAQKGFILYNGRPFNFGYEFGLRYNVGSAIARE